MKPHFRFVPDFAALELWTGFATFLQGVDWLMD